MVHFTAGCAAHRSYVAHEMVPLGVAMPKTVESSTCVVPPRAPTIRSVPRMVPWKLSRTPRRTCSMPTSSATESAMLAMVSVEISRRLRSERQASARRTLIAPPRGRRSRDGRGRAVDVAQLDGPREAGGEAEVVAHEHQRAPRLVAAREEQFEEAIAPVRIERARRLVADDDLRARR
jgi:hypothetical protein